MSLEGRFLKMLS